jgi:hypothetical protein
MRKLKYVKLFEDFGKDNLEIVLEKYINDDIKDYEIYQNLEILIINENMLSSLKDKWISVKDKSNDLVLDFLVKMYIKIGNTFNNFKKFIGKIFKLLFWLVDKISKFKEKHPKLFKIILLSSLIIFLIIISSSSAYAGNTKPLLDAGSKLIIDGTTTVEINHVSVFIGYLDKVDIGLSGQELAKYKSILVDLKDGKIDGTWNISEVKSVIELAKNSLSKFLNNVDKNDIVVDHARLGRIDFGGSNAQLLVNDFANVGRRFVDFDHNEFINNGIKTVDAKFINASGEIISSHSSIGSISN